VISPVRVVAGDQGEAGQVQAQAARPRPLPSTDVDLEVLHGRVEDLLDGPGEAVDLVHEQDVARPPGR
jgi:hypothetical protein